MVALTFDDGPDSEYTPRTLELLSSLQIHATFFVEGGKAAKLDSLVTRQVLEGMELGSHTWSHAHLLRMTVSSARDDIARGQAVLARRGIDARLFRAPYGEISSEQLEQVRSLGFTPVHWTASVDRYVGSMRLDPNQAALALAAALRPGDIILAHDSAGPRRDRAFDALERLLIDLTRRDFQVTTVTRLLDHGRAVRARGRTWFWQSGFRCPR